MSKMILAAIFALSLSAFAEEHDMDSMAGGDEMTMDGAMGEETPAQETKMKGKKMAKKATKKAAKKGKKKQEADAN